MRALVNQITSQARMGTSTSVVKQASRSIRIFAQSMAESGDVTIAYLESHPNCASKERAKYAGRALLKRGDVRALIALEKAKVVIGQGDSNPRKAALLEELNLVAFAGVNLKKLHPKEKLTALRTIAEIEGWMKPKEQGAGLRATFNFNVGGTRRGAQDRTVVTVVDMGEGSVEGEIDGSGPVESIPVGAFGVELDLDSPQASSELRSNPTRVVGVGLPSESESESESGPPLTADGWQPRAIDSDSRAVRAQALSQVLDSTENSVQQAQKDGNVGAQDHSRSTPTGRSRASDSRQSVHKSPSRLFDAANT